MKPTRQFFITLLAVSPLFLAVVLYGYTIRLTLFLDDAPQFFILDQLGDVEYWGGSLAYHYYRPFLFSFWKAAHAIAGDYDPVQLHWINIMLFGVTGVVLGQLTAKLVTYPHRHLMGAIAGIGFVIFPFSYQAVILVGAQYHLMLALCTVLVLWLALLWMEHKIGMLGLLIALVITFIGAFSHENSPGLVGILGLMIWIKFGWAAIWQRRTLMFLIPVTLIELIYIYLWLTVPRDQEYGAFQTIDSMLWSLGMLLQGLVYPFDALVALFILEGSTALILSLVGIVLAACGVVIWRYKSYRLIFGFSLAWYLLGIIPATLLLDTAYVDGSARLMYFSAAAASILWALVLGVLIASRQQFLQAIAAMIMLASIGVSTIYLQQMQDWALMQNRYMYRLSDLILHQPSSGADGGIGLVNAVDFITPETRDDYMFLRGSEGVAFMFHTNDYALQIWITAKYQPPYVLTASYGQILRNQGYSFTPHQPELDEPNLAAWARDRDYLYVTHFDDQGFMPVYVGGRDVAGNNDPLVQFGDAVTLLEGDVMYIRNLQRASVRLRWQVNQPQSVKPFVHVVCDGVLVANSDAAPWGETYPFSYWAAGEIQTEFREIPLSTPYDSQQCQARVGVYDQLTGDRLPTTPLTAEQAIEDLYILSYLGESQAGFPFVCLNPPPQFPLLCEDL